MKTSLLSVLISALLAISALGAAAVGNGNGSANGNASKEVDPVGVYKWVTPNRNGQPLETILTITRDKGNQLTGTLADRLGTVPLTEVTFRNGALSFSVVRETPSGKITTAYSGEFNAGELALATERPDPAGTAPDEARAAAPGQAAKTIRASVKAARVDGK